MENPNETPPLATAKWQACWRLLHPAFALVAGVCLLALVGWIGRVDSWTHGCTVIVGVIFSLERAASLSG